MKLTKSQRLFIKAGVYQERAKSCLELRKYHFYNAIWHAYTEESKKWKAKAERFLKRAEKVAEEEQHDLIVKVINDVPN